MPTHFIAFWNLENLFAPEHYEEREQWIAQKMALDLKGWTQELFDTKIAQLGIILRQMNNSTGPDILGVCEAENAFVLEQLASHLNQHLSDRTYGIAHVDSSLDQRGIDTAFLYDKERYSVDEDAIFSHFVMRRTGTRDITQVTFTTQAGNDLVALCNHWPSRSGGTYESQGYRTVAGETLSYWHQRIWEERSNTIPIIAMGDFNDDPFDASLCVHARATRERGDVIRAKKAPRFYNLTWHYLEQNAPDRNGRQRTLHGTLYYKGNGNVFDQILVSRGLLLSNSPIRVQENTARMEVFPEMVDHKISYGPIRFGLSKGNADKNVNPQGFSDHFPVSVILEED